MRNTEKMLGLSLFSRSFQPRERVRDVAPKGKHKEICRVLWEPWGQWVSLGKVGKASGRRRSLDLPTDQDIGGQRKKGRKVLQVERSICPKAQNYSESVEKLRGSQQGEAAGGVGRMGREGHTTERGLRLLHCKFPNWAEASHRHLILISWMPRLRETCGSHS